MTKQKIRRQRAEKVWLMALRLYESGKTVEEIAEILPLSWKGGEPYRSVSIREMLVKARKIRIKTN